MYWINKLFISSFLCLHYVYVSSGKVTLSLNYDKENYKFLNYRLTNKLDCNITGEVPPNLELKWYKNEHIFEPTESRFEFKDHQLIIRKTEDSDIATYECALVDKETQNVVHRSGGMNCVGKPTSKIVVVAPTSNPVDEGGTIKLECVVQGNPTPMIQWLKDDARLDSVDRIKISDNIEDKAVPHAYLEITNVEMSDRGNYYCRAQNIVNDFINGTDAFIFIRVKDKLAALWPFIGICAEVLVLCIIIFFYERKRNKSELDESDTDQSPEQKNTPDHGKDTVRQRK